MTPLMVVLGGALGAVARYLVDHRIDHWVSRHLGRSVGFPYATVVINVSGSFGLGCLMAGANTGALITFGATGFCGAYTTFSTFGVETARLITGRRLGAAMLNVVVSLGAGLLAASAGWALVAALV